MANRKSKKDLTSEQYHVMWEGGTEAPFTGKYVNEKSDGMYHCASCGAELFSSNAKFDSGTGWPSFYKPVNFKNVDLSPDNSLGVNRTEVKCKKCGAHLGHVFDDLPFRIKTKTGEPKEKTGKRYCINSCSLDLKLRQNSDDLK